jgi:hypothetical protein
MSTDPATVQAVAAMLTEELDEEQLDLLAPPETARGQALVGEVKRGPGRPKGARNKRTQRVVAWLMAKYRDPREALMAVVDMHPADLAALLHCSILQAFQEWRQCAFVAHASRRSSPARARKDLTPRYSRRALWIRRKYSDVGCQCRCQFAFGYRVKPGNLRLSDGVGTGLLDRSSMMRLANSAQYRSCAPAPGRAGARKKIGRGGYPGFSRRASHTPSVTRNFSLFPGFCSPAPQAKKPNSALLRSGEGFGYGVHA